MAVENTGQIQLSQPFGTILSKQASDARFQSQLEIGTWNGRGSTCCFADGFAKRTDTPVLKSQEIHPQRVAEAQSLWKGHPNVDIVQGRILKECPPQAEVKELFPALTEQWHAEDVLNFARAPQVSVEDPEVVLLDGAEYLTYFEFKNVVQDCPSVRVILLDDSNRARAEKTWRIREHLLQDPSWTHVVGSQADRNGWDVFEKNE